MKKLVADVHMHSIVSGHAFGTIRELARQAAGVGLSLIGITEHGPGIPGTVDPIYFRAASIGLLDYMIPKNLDDALTRLDAAKLVAAWGEYDLIDSGVSFDDCQDLTAREQSIISTLMEEEVVLSTGPDSWSPDTTVSKSAFAMIIYRGLGSPDGDIVGQNWQLNIFKWISKVGIMQDGVGINSVITQEQALEYLMEAAQLRNAF